VNKLQMISAGAVAAAALFGGGWMGGAQSASEPTVVEQQAIAEAASWSMTCNGMVVCQPFTPAPSSTPSPSPTATEAPATATRTPSITPSGVTATPLEVTPLGTPAYPRYVQADRDYVPLVRLRIRRDPFQANNWTGLYAETGSRYKVHHVREYADGSVWACIQDNVHPASCTRWFVIRADLTGPAPDYIGAPDGKIENYAKEAPELDG
jgi:hypothetical protein